MEFVTVDWCTGKYLNLDQTIRNLTCDDLEISLVVIRLGVTGLKKTGLCTSWTCLGKEGGRGGMILCKWSPFR